MLNKMKSKLITANVFMLITAANIMADDNPGINIGSGNMLTPILQQPLVKATVQTGIIFGILYAIFLIAKDLVSGDSGGGGKGPWGKLGAIIAFAILYYFLYGGGMTS
jgi:hypothetical protein